MSDAYGQCETPWPGAARIEIQHPVLRFHLRLVRVPDDDGMEAGGRRVDVELIQDVPDVEAMVADLHDLGFRQVSGPRTPVDVAAHGKHRRELPQRVEDVGTADVAGVDDRGA